MRVWRLFLPELSTALGELAAICAARWGRGLRSLSKNSTGRVYTALFFRLSCVRLAYPLYVAGVVVSIGSATGVVEGWTAIAGLIAGLAIFVAGLVAEHREISP
jgi:hypothetical protein